jgi:hypothetical protein
VADVTSAMRAGPERALHGHKEKLIVQLGVFQGNALGRPDKCSEGDARMRVENENTFSVDLFLISSKGEIANETRLLFNTAPRLLVRNFQT